MEPSLKVDAQKIIGLGNINMERTREAPSSPFKPVVDGTFYKNKQDSFISEEPWLLMSSGRFNKVPLITGNTEDDGFIVFADYANNQTEMFEFLQNDWDDEIVRMLFNRWVKIKDLRDPWSKCTYFKNI